MPEAAGPASSGVLLAAKPAGVTSHDVVAAERRKLGKGGKVGHAGTLDPFATGLLLILKDFRLTALLPAILAVLFVVFSLLNLLPQV